MDVGWSITGKGVPSVEPFLPAVVILSDKLRVLASNAEISRGFMILNNLKNYEKVLEQTGNNLIQFLLQPQIFSLK